MPKGQHRPVEARIETAKAKRDMNAKQLVALEMKSSVLAVKEKKVRTRISRWEARIEKLEALKPMPEPVTPNA